MKPKEWLLKNGHIKEITRGRMSRESIALINEAVKAGTVIEGYPSPTGPNKPTASGTDKPESKVEKTSTGIANIPEFPLRDENRWEAYANIDGKLKTIGMRTVCNTCKNSLTYCPCKSPVVNLDFDTVGVVNFRIKSN